MELKEDIMYLAREVFENQPEFLKSQTYQNISCTVNSETVVANEKGKKYVYGGSLLDKEGNVVEITRSGSVGAYSYSFSANPVGILFKTVEVTHGSQPGALMIDGAVNAERLQGEYTAEAVQDLIPLLPYIKFFVDGTLQIKQ